MGDYKIISSAGSTSATAPPNAPNITSASCSAYYGTWGNVSALGIQGTINLPTGSSVYSHLEEIDIAVTRADGSTAPLQTLYAAFSGSSVTFKTPCIIPQLQAIESLTVTFTVKNDANVATPSPVTVTISVQASAVTSVAAAFSAANNTYDPATRQTHAHPTFVPTMNGNQVPQCVPYWLSQDGGLTFGFYGVPTIETVGQSFAADTIAPSVAQSWQFACAVGWFSYSSSVPIPKAQLLTLAPNCVFSNMISIPALALASATDIVNITIPAGAGGSFPYDVQLSDGTQQWQIPAFTIDDTVAAADLNAYAVQITIQNLDASHNPLPGVAGIEKIFAGFQVSKTGGVYTSNPLGPFSYMNGIAYIRYRVYVINRAEGAANTGWTDLVNVGRLQAGGGGNLNAGYVDVLIAAGGAVPPPTFTPKNMAPNSFGPNYYVDPTTGQVNPGTTTDNLIINGDFSQGTNGWAQWNGAFSIVQELPRPTTMNLNCLKIVPDTLGNAFVTQAKAFPCVPGDQFFFQFWYRVTSLGAGSPFVPCRPSVNIYYMDQNGAFMGAGTVLDGTGVNATAGWSQGPITLTTRSGGAPVGAAFITLYVGAFNVPAGAAIELENVVLRHQVSTGPGQQPDGKGGTAAKYSATGGVSVDLNGNMVVDQAALAITNFTGNLDVSRIGNLAAVAIANFAGNLDVSRIANLSTFSITNFNGNLDISRVNNITSINIGTLAGTLNVTYQVADGSIPINKIATLYVSNIYGWDGAAITVNSGMQFSGGPGTVRICDSLHGPNLGLYVSSNLRCDGVYYSGTTAGRTDNVTIGTVQLHFLNGLYTGFSNIG